MHKKAISIALLLLGVAFATLALNQLNQMVISNAQSDLARPVAEAQIMANEELARSYGQSEAEVAAISKESRELLENSISAMSNSYLTTALVDGILGLVLLFAGVMTYPREH